MRRPPKAFSLLFLLLLSASCSSSSSFVPSTTFSSNLRFAFSEIQKLTSLISYSSGILGGNLRLSSAIHDCLDLLDLSADELTWTLSLVNDQPVKTPATGNHRYDLHSWLSAAVGNQDTCKDGLDSAGGPLGGLAAGGLKIVSSLISNSLHEVAASSGGRCGGRRLLGFPEWVSAGDRRLLQTPAPAEPDAVVAQDGSGDYTSVGAAVEAAPSESESSATLAVTGRGPEGWVEWNGNTIGLDTLYYAEYMNDGPGSGLEGRVNWPGYHAISDPAEAGEFTVAQFIDGDSWLPATGVKYTSGLTM
ncbi:hypothetical protein OPV22_011363 [Ensete ventricosum]|uniref:Pectinesterase inhibitor domain-containing protein n=1 Tax=Ensete ventricosum TaxID=4639 RepID=A0AAV8RJF2_ENSVE|nr:hypothetical protein OPV22_011363 [Ensete ventricosum]